MNARLLGFPFPTQSVRHQLGRRSGRRRSFSAVPAQFLEQRINLSPVLATIDILEGLPETTASSTSSAVTPSTDSSDSALTHPAASQPNAPVITVHDDLADAEPPLVTVHVDASFSSTGSTAPLDHASVRFQLQHTNVVVTLGDHTVPHDTDNTDFPPATAADIALLNSLGLHVEESVLTANADHEQTSIPHWLTSLVTATHHSADTNSHEDAGAIAEPVNESTADSASPQQRASTALPSGQNVVGAALPGTEQREAVGSATDELGAVEAPEVTDTTSRVNRWKQSGGSWQLSLPDESSGAQQSSTDTAADQRDSAATAASPLSPASLSASPTRERHNLVDQVYADLANFPITLDFQQPGHADLPIQYLQRIKESGLSLVDEPTTSLAVPAYALLNDREPQTASMAFWLAAMTAAGIAYRSRRFLPGRSAGYGLPPALAPAPISARFRHDAPDRPTRD